MTSFHLSRPVLAILLAMVMLSSCSYYTETIPKDRQDDPIFGAWHLIATQAPGAAEIPLAAPEAYTIEFGTNNRLAGRADCNRYFGGYEIGKKGQIQVLALGVTQAACAPESIAGEYLRVLGAAMQFEMRAGNLRVTAADGATLIFAR